MATMSRFSYQEKTTTSDSVAECVEAGRRTLTDLGAGPRPEGAGLVGHLGSQAKMRLVGGIFGSRESYPVRIAVQVEDTGSQRTVLVDAAENVGIGWLIGMEGRLRERCQQVSLQVLEGIERRLATAR
jgi:hypothetical protein